MSAARDTGGTAAIGYDVATALWQGKRPYQEDTLLADFHGGMDRGFAVLADGMGGHAAGDLASRLVVIDAVSHLKFLIHDGATLEQNLVSELTSAIETANDVLRDRAAEDSRLQGMGATFLATVMFEDRLYWASVGDSPLYLWREGKLRQLNEDHSMAPVIDQMAKSGEITEEEAANHPDRNALTSVLMGRKVKVLDVPKTATVLDPGDVLIQASDGLQFLGDDGIAKVLEAAGAAASSRKIADHLMRALHALDDPTQDNTAILVLQLTEHMGGGSSTAVAGDTRAVSALERAVEAASASSAANRTAKASASAPQAPRAEAPADVPRPPGGRRWLVPAALLGGAALALGLIFGLPSEQDAIDTASGTPPPATSEPGAPVSTESDPVADVGDDIPADPELQADVGDALPDPEAASAPDAGEESDGIAETSEEIVIEDGPAADPAPAEVAADASPVEAGDQTSPRGGESGGRDPEAANGQGGQTPDVPRVVDPETAIADPGDAVPGEDFAEDGDGQEPGPVADPAAGIAAATPQRSGDVAAASSRPIPRPDVTAPQSATETGAVIDAAPTVVAAPEAPPLDGDVVAPEAAGAEAAASIAPGGASTSSGLGGVEVDIPGARAPEVANGIVSAPEIPAPVPAPAVLAPLTLAPQPLPEPAPAQIVAPVPDTAPSGDRPSPVLPLGGATPAPGQIVPTPGTGRVNETMSAPADPPAPVPAPTPVPAPEAQPQSPTGPRIQFLPQDEEVNFAPLGGSSQIDQATLTAPGPSGGGRAPSHPELGPRATPVLPPFTTSIQGICRRYGCFAIITHRSNRPGLVIRDRDRPTKHLIDQ